MTSCEVSEAELRRPERFALHDACERRDVHALTQLLQVNEARTAAYFEGKTLEPEPVILDVNERDPHGCTALHVAALNGAVDCFNYLLSHTHAKTNTKCNGSPLTHLLAALLAIPDAADAALSMINVLLARPEVDVFASDDVGRSLLSMCAWVDAVTVMDALEGRIATAAASAAAALAGVPDVPPGAIPSLEVNAADKFGRRPLHFAAAAGCDRALKWLLARGADVDVKDMRGDTPAHAAARAGWRDGMDALVHAMRDRSVTNNAGLSADDSFVPRLPSEAASARTLLLTHPLCSQHHTCAPVSRQLLNVPPENTERISTLLSTRYGTLRTTDFGNRCDLVFGAPSATISDVLRVHEYDYIRRILTFIGSIGDDDVKLLDMDTAVSRQSWAAALHAAGAVCAAIDDVIAGRHRNAFCIVRPPGHHAGPRGVVSNHNDTDGSHGFCLLNNVAVGAAYARAVHGRSAYQLNDAASSGAPIRRIAIFDFDVHHGNGTEAIIRNLYPTEVVETITLPFMKGAFSTISYKPWLDEGDGDDVLFISSHGYGKRDPSQPESASVAWFYPGSGASEGWNTSLLSELRGDTALDCVAASTPSTQEAECTDSPNPAAPRPAITRHGDPSSVTFETVPAPEPLFEGRIRAPRLINVAVPHGTPPRLWRRIMTADVLPRLAAFNPDLILISAGFDAHHKDVINCGYVGLRDEDYEWITQQLVKIANTTCEGRIVSVLEGGYRVHGRVVSAFGRSVASHVRALSSQSTERWDTAIEKARLLEEIRAELQAEREQAAAAASRTAPPPTLPRRLRPAATPLASPSVDTPEARRGPPASAPTPVQHAASSTSSEGAPAVTETSATPGADDLEGRRKRRRSAAAVDYAALDAQLRAEQAAAKSGQP